MVIEGPEKRTAQCQPLEWNGEVGQQTEPSQIPWWNRKSIEGDKKLDREVFVLVTPKERPQPTGPNPRFEISCLHSNSYCKALVTKPWVIHS